VLELRQYFPRQLAQLHTMVFDQIL
jgi:hypothetical protein